MKKIEDETFYVPFTRLQLMKVFEHIKRIDQHFDECCAFNNDRCNYQGKYEELYKVLEMAGIPDEFLPFGGTGEEKDNKFNYHLDKLTEQGQVLFDKDVIG